MGSLFFKSGKEKLKKNNKGFFDLEALDIDGKSIKFDSFKDKRAIIVINVACKCGFAKTHYSELMELYNKYRYIN
jgi:glutathione peroxidase